MDGRLWQFGSSFTIYCFYLCSFAKQSYTFCHNYVAGLQTALHNVLLPAVHTCHLYRSGLRFSVHNLICKYFILYLKCSGLRNDQCTRFFCRYNHIARAAAVQQSFPVGKYCPQADCSGVPVYHSADCLDSSLLRIVRSVIQLEADFRHLFQCFFLRSVASDQS